MPQVGGHWDHRLRDKPGASFQDGPLPLGASLHGEGRPLQVFVLRAVLTFPGMLRKSSRHPQTNTPGVLHGASALFSVSPQQTRRTWWVDGRQVARAPVSALPRSPAQATRGLELLLVLSPQPVPPATFRTQLQVPSPLRAPHGTSSDPPGSFRVPPGPHPHLGGEAGRLKQVETWGSRHRVTLGQVTECL